MKIAFLNSVVHKYATGDPTATGGAERLQWLLASALAGAGWSVAVGVTNRLAPGKEEVVSGVRFVGMGPSNSVHELLPAWSRFLNRERPDWWYFQGADPWWGALVLIANRKGVRGIFSAGFDTDVMPRMALNRHRFSWPLYAWGMNAVERIFVQHTGQLQDLNPRLQPKAKVLPGVVTLRPEIKPWAERGGYIAWVAVLRQPKRPDILIELARHNPDLRYVVCGGTSAHRTPGGKSKQWAAELATLPNVEYLGHVDPARTLEIIGRANALLSTSDGEGFPSTFLEAWAAGTPVVSRRIDPDGLIKERGLGFVSSDVADHLRSLVTSPEPFTAISDRARTYIERVHSDSAVARVFSQAIAKAG